VLGALIDIPANVGYAAVFGLIAIETMGIPVPGETALIAAALLAHEGQMDIFGLVAVAAAAAILGDNVGFFIGRHGGRQLLLHPGPLLAQRRRVIEVGEPFFERHGAKAVFLGRWVSGLRIASAWLAGINGMSWAVFLPWNALGGILWTAVVGFGVYLVGGVAKDIFEIAGPIAAAVFVAGLVAVLVLRHRRSRR
jgi:membrane protein DedA with SNARE-associated domain